MSERIITVDIHKNLHIYLLTLKEKDKKIDCIYGNLDNVADDLFYYCSDTGCYDVIINNESEETKEKVRDSVEEESKWHDEKHKINFLN